MNTLLILSLLTLMAGPLLLDFLASRQYAYRALDTFILVAIFGLVLLHVLPESVELIGWSAVFIALAGFLAPLALGKLFHSGGCHMHRSLVSLASIGLLAHTLLDGMALAGAGSHHQHHSEMLGFAVILHRLPEGMGLWRLARYSLGTAAAIATLIVVGLVTILGFFFGGQILAFVPEQGLVVFQSLMAGILLHVIFHRRHIPEQTNEGLQKRRKGFLFSSAIGATLGVLLTTTLFMLHGQDNHADHFAPDSSHEAHHHHGH